MRIDHTCPDIINFYTMWKLVGLVLIALALQVNGQTSLMSTVHMDGVRAKVVFATAGSGVTATFTQAETSGITGSVTIRIHPVWMDYGVADKCTNAQLGIALTGKTNTQTYPAALTLASTTLQELEGKSLVIVNGGKTTCGTIQQDGNHNTAVAHLRQDIFGDIYFRQFGTGGSTVIVSDLKTFSGATSANWVIANANVDCSNPGNPTMIAVYNPTNTNGGSCSQSAQSNCAVGNLNGKLGAAQVGDGSTLTRASYTDSNLAISDSNSVVGKYLIVYDPSNVQTLACTKIYMYQERMAKSTFSHGGISGTFTFRQRSPFDPTQSTVSLQGLANGARGYHVHNWPNPVQSTSSQNLCANDVVAGHLNPLSITVDQNYPMPRTTTDDLYEVGDLSSKYGTFQGMTSFGPSNFVDWNLPLFGVNSIIGRSIVIHRDDATSSRWVCSNIEPEGTVISAVAVFTAPVIGQIYFTQAMGVLETYIFARLNYFDGRAPTTGHQWHVYTSQVGRSRDCSATGAMFNPYGIFAGDNTYNTKCNSDGRFCREGDLSGKFGLLGVGGTGSNDARAKRFHIDGSLRLSGSQSLIGKSVVIMDASNTNIMACANIQMLRNLHFSAQFNTGSYTGRVMFTQRAGFGQIPTMVSTTGLNGFNANSHRLEIRTHPAATGSNPCANLGNVYDPLQATQQSPQTHDQYKVGDLSRRGTMTQWYDLNLPMKGPISINGHSLAILSQNNIVTCANIDFYVQSEGYKVTSLLKFVGPIVGDVYVSQLLYNDYTLSETLITMDLRNSDNSASASHNWHVHVTPIDGDATATSGRCASAGPHYDPFMAQIGSAATTYSTQCDLLTPLRCEVGDQANKLGTYSLGSGKQVYNDVYLPLDGEYSIQGRSIVIHMENRGVPRLACADIIPTNGLYTAAEFNTPQNFKKRDAAGVFAGAVNTQVENIVVEVLSQSGGVTKTNIHYLGRSRNQLKAQFESFIAAKSNRNSLGVYSSITLTGNASHVISSVVVLLFSFVIGKLLR